MQLALLRLVALFVILAMGAIAATGFHTIRRDIENLQIISRDNILWSSTQMEIELLRFQRSLSVFSSALTPEALDVVRERFDILLSRFGLVREGRVGEILRQYDDGFGTLEQLLVYLEGIEPVIDRLAPGVADPDLPAILAAFDDLQPTMRRYSLRVVRGDTAAAAEVRDRMRTGSMLTASISLGAFLICLVALILLVRENGRARAMAAMQLRQAREAEAATLAKSRLLTMMSHEMRNPLQGVLGPLALIRQTDLADGQRRLLDRAERSGRNMSRMLASLLDYGDVEDGTVTVEDEPFKLRCLARDIEAAIRDAAEAQASSFAVTVDPAAPDMVRGDFDRLARLFAQLGGAVADAAAGGAAGLRLTHGEDELVGEFALPGEDDAAEWMLSFVTGEGRAGGGAFASDALGLSIAKGLLRVLGGVISIIPSGAGTTVRVAVPCRKLALDRIAVWIETRSSAMETLYRAALRSERVSFLAPAQSGDADIVLVDATSIGTLTPPELRARFPHALFIALGLPSSPAFYDEIVDAPTDIAGLRDRVLARLVS